MTTLLPEWIRDPDGTRVPFEPEAISRDLFAVMEDRGEPNSFLARELTDAVLIFLAPQAEPEIEREELNDLVRKVVRELGYPDLAEQYEATRDVPDPPPERPTEPSEDVTAVLLDAIRERASPLELRHVASRQLLEIYSQCHVYPRDLVCAAEQGLIVLTGLDSPLELASMNLHLNPDDDLLDAVLEASRVVSDRVVLFGVEKLALDPSRVRHELIRAGEITDLHLEVRLNHDDAPAASTGLFAAETRESRRSDSREWLNALQPHRHLSVGWHLKASDWTPEANADFPTAREVTFHFDRARPIAKSDSVLTSVGMNLSRLLLAELGDTNEDEQYDKFLKKLGSLARLAKSVGHVRRRFLRKHARESALRGFRLERARLQITLVGLEEVARHLAGSAAGSPSKWVEMQAKLIAAIREALERDRPGSLETAVETVQTFESEPLTVPQQIRFGAQLQHAAGGHGTLCLRFEAESLVEILRRAWDAGIGRLKLI